MKTIIVFLLFTSLLVGCGATMKPRDQMVAPTPVADMSGSFVSPFKRDGDLAAWAEKSFTEEISKNVAGNVSESVGANIGAKIGGSWGALLGGAASKVAARRATRQAFLTALGGEDYIRETSDLSFNSLEELAQYMYVVNASHPQYAEALNATMFVYPELEDIYEDALKAL